MPKNIPIALAIHQALPATTLCYVQKVGPLPGGGYITLTSLDRNVVFDDGGGELTYYARTGMQLSNLSASNDLSVDNGETSTLEELPVYPAEGLTEAMVDNGDLDGLEFTIYQINYMSPSDGGEIIANGPIGEVRIVEGGLITFEHRSWSQLLKQNSVCELDSLTCRAIFGSQSVQNSNGDAVIQRHPCNYDLTLEWVDFTVSGVGADVYRQFSTEDLAQGDDYFNPGLVEWHTGANADMNREVDGFEANSNDSDVTLQFSVRNPIQVGDTGRIRRDCTRKWSGHNSCDTYANRQWFRGEPFIPVSDSMALAIPQAGSGGGMTF